MIVYSLLLLTIVLAACAVFLAWRCGRYRGTYRLLQLLLAVSSAVFIHLYGAWVFISVYARYAFDLCFLIILFSAIITNRPVSAMRGTIIRLFATVFFFGMSILYFTGTTGVPYGIASLSLPFKRGTYFVFQGGKGLPTNVFHYKLRGAVYAMDLVKLNNFGNRASRIFSRDLHDYEIYSDTLYSPCDGIVAKTNDGNPDNIPPVRQRGPSNTNYILLETGSMYVFMAHLKPSSIFVSAGQHVRVGQPIALCGNSGFSLEPHLHIQAHANTNTGLPWYREKPLQLLFNGKFNRLFDEIKGG